MFDTTDTTDSTSYQQALHFIQLAANYQDEELRTARARADSYFEGGTPDGLRDRPNKSRYVDTVLRDTILWLLPNFSRVFHSGEKVIEIMPRDPEGSVRCLIAQEWVNQVLNIDNSAFLEDSQAMQDALMYRLGWQRFEWDEDRVMITCRSIDTRHVLWPRSATLNRLEWPFIGVKTETTIAELRADGYKVDDDIWGDDLEGEDETSIYAREMTDDDLSLVDKSLREVKKYELWWPNYEDGNWHYICIVGRTILREKDVPEHPMVYFTPILMSHRLDGLSVADLSFKLQELSTAIHRAMNDYFYRLGNPREEVVTPQMTEFTMPDLLKDQYDGRIRVKAPNTIVPIAAPPMPMNAIELLDHYDERTSARTGVQKYQQGLSPDALNKTASGTAMIMDAASLRIEQIARTFAETGYRERVGVILRLSMQRPDLLSQRSVTIRGAQMPLSPEMLPGTYDLLVNVGVGVGNRTERRGVLGSTLEFYSALLTNPAATRMCPGGDLAVFSSQNVYETMREILKLVGYTNTHDFAVDPSNQSPMVHRDPPAPPSPPSPEEMYVAVEREKVGLSREKTLYDQFREVADMQLKVRQAKAAAAETLAKAEHERQQALFEHKKLTDSIDRAKAEMALKERELEQRDRELDIKAADLVLKYQEAGILPVEQHAILEDQLSTVAESIKALEGPLSAVASPRTILRGEDGSILGTEAEVNGRKVRHIIRRDPEGNPIGVEQEAPAEEPTNPEDR